MPCCAPFHIPRRLVAALLVLAIVGLAACSSTVTSGGVEVTNKAIATAGRAAHVAEVALVTATDALTAGYEAGFIPATALQHFLAVVAPKIKAALATTKVAIKTAAAAPGATPIEVVLTAVLELQEEVTVLQGWFSQSALIVKGTTP